jgi:hypothetical protein
VQAKTLAVLVQISQSDCTPVYVYDTVPEFTPDPQLTQTELSVSKMYPSALQAVHVIALAATVHEVHPT